MRISVIIPVYNGSGFLRRSLAALKTSTHRDFECLVVDDGSSDDSAEVARAAGVEVLSLAERGGPARARNRGAQRAGGEVLAFFDADVCVHPDTLTRIDEHLRAHPAAVAVMGSYDDAPADPSFVSQYKNLFHHYVHQRSRSNAWTFWAGCGAIRRAAFLAAGGFDESYRRPCIEDIELGARLSMQGQRIDLDATIQVTHLKRWTLASLVRTDLFDRAVPWFVLMLRTRHMPPDLNVAHAHRISVVLAWLMALGCVPLLVSLLSRSATGIALSVAMLVPVKLLFLALNRDLYQFFIAKRGWWFALRAVALHWLYYLYCGVGVILGTVEWARSRSPLEAEQR